MRWSILLVLLAVWGCLGEPSKEYESNREHNKEWNNKDDQEINMQKYDFRDEGDHKIRPCTTSDWQCIRKFLAENSDCSISKGPAPDPLIIPYDKFFIPLVNLTITLSDMHVEGFDSAKVTEFYVNKETNNLVMAISVQNYKQTTPKAYFSYQRTGKEPIILSDFATVTYRSLTFTAIIPNYPHLKLELAEIHVDVDDGTPYYVIGPGAGNSTDPDVITALAEFNARLPIVIRESFVFHSYLATGVFIQRKLCDFGVDVYNNYLKFITTKAFTITPQKYVLNKDYYQ